MPKFIVKIAGKYLEWSTIVDAPSTYGMTLEQFKAYYRDEYGRLSMRELEERLARVEVTGTSSMLGEPSAEATVVPCNRMGDYYDGPWKAEGRSELTWEEIQQIVRDTAMPEDEDWNDSEEDES